MRRALRNIRRGRLQRSFALASGLSTLPLAFEIYLEHFRGERATSLSLMGMAAGDVDEAWTAFTGALGLESRAPGERCETTGSNVQRLAGVVEPLAEIGHGRRVLLRLDEPAPGVALLGAFNCAGAVMTTISVYFYGPE